jgi:hypothetical protein
MIAADDQLLDTLAAGGTPANGDEVGVMLAAWRANLTAESTLRCTALNTEVDGGDPGPSARRPSRPVPLSSRVVLGAVAAVVALAGTVTVLAGDARPESPLWPITRILYTDWASSVAAEQEAQQSIDWARQAITEARYSDAARLLGEAAASADKVRDPSAAAKLRDEIHALRALLPGVLAGPATTHSPPGEGGAADPGPGGGSPAGSDRPLPAGAPPTRAGGAPPTSGQPPLALPTPPLALPTPPLPAVPRAQLPPTGGRPSPSPAELSPADPPSVGPAVSGPGRRTAPTGP